MNADRDWVRAERCFKDKDFVFCLFLIHLSLEKICKGLWVKYNEGNTPPKIHNLVKILDQTSLKFNSEQTDLMLSMNTYQLEGRYTDYQDKIYKTATKEFTQNLMDESESLKKCLLEKLQ